MTAIPAGLNPVLGLNCRLPGVRMGVFGNDAVASGVDANAAAAGGDAGKVIGQTAPNPPPQFSLALCVGLMPEPLQPLHNANCGQAVNALQAAQAGR